MRRRPPLPANASTRQRGVVLIFALVALVILMIGAVAMIRSMSTAQFSIGNLGFKRDMANQGERALAQVLTDFNTGALSTTLSREASVISSNYSAIMLADNEQGLPVALLGNDAGFAAVGSTAKDIVTDVGVTVRYVVDRLSTAAGPCGPDTCITATQAVPGGSFSEWNNAQNNNGVGGAGAAPPQPVYRLTVRVTGPRGTQSYFQSTFTL